MTHAPIRESLFREVDDYVCERLIASDPGLDATLASITRERLPEIQVSSAQAQYLALLVRAIDARNVLEIGTLAGFSAIAMARELPAEGKLITLEFDPRHADIARRNVDVAGLSSIVDIRIGAALDSLVQIERANEGPFDLFFIDADKRNNSNYLDWAIRLSHPGSVIIVDNVIREGRVLDAASQDESVRGTRALFDHLHELVRAGRVTSTAIQTVGSKGYDGFAIAVVRR